MKSPRHLLFLLAVLLAMAFDGCAVTGVVNPSDHVTIANVEVEHVKNPNFVVFRVTVDYRLTSRPEGMIGLNMVLGDTGKFSLLAEHHVTHGAGTVELMAECERSPGGKQRLMVNLQEFPRTVPLAMLTSRSETVALPQ